MPVADRVTECETGGERTQAPDEWLLLELVAIIENPRDGFFNRGVALSLRAAPLKLIANDDCSAMIKDRLLSVPGADPKTNVPPLPPAPYAPARP